MRQWRAPARCVLRPGQLACASDCIANGLAANGAVHASTPRADANQHVREIMHGDFTEGGGVAMLPTFKGGQYG
jgi:hypothetical protein